MISCPTDSNPDGFWVSYYVCTLCSFQVTCLPGFHSLHSLFILEFCQKIVVPPCRPIWSLWKWDQLLVLTIGLLCECLMNVCINLFLPNELLKQCRWTLHLTFFKLILFFFRKDSANISLSPGLKSLNFYLLHDVLKCICILDKKMVFCFVLLFILVNIGHFIPDFHS